MSYTGERKKWRIEPYSARPRNLNTDVLNRVNLYNVPGSGTHCWIRFANDFKIFVGKRMPRGASELFPVALAVTYLDGVYSVWGRYLDESAEVKLWSTRVRPSWIKEKKHGNNKSSATQAGGTSDAG